MSFVLLIAANTGLWLLAIALQRLVPTGSRGGDVAAAGILHAVVASVLALALGCFGGLTPTAMTVAGVAAGVAGLAIGGAKAVRGAWEALADILKRVYAESPGAVLVLGGVAALLVFRQVVDAWLFCPYTVDEHAYRLPRLVAWVETGSVARPDLLDPRAWFPAGMQLLQAWWVVIPHHDAMVEGAALEMAFVGAAATAALARSLGAKPVGAALAGLLWACAPIVVVQACSAIDDAAAGACVLAAAAALVNPASFRRGAIHAALALLVGMGIKPTVLFVAPVLAVLAWLALRKERGRAPAELPAFRMPVAAVLLFAAAVAGSWWYAANLREFHNPFFPIVPGLSGESQRLGKMPVTMTGGPSVPKMFANVAQVFGRNYVRFDPNITPTADRTGWGIPIALAGPLALLWMLFREKSWRAPAAVFAGGVLLTLLLVEKDGYNARFVLWAAALPAAALGAVAARLPKTWIAVTVLLYAAGADLVRTSVPACFRTPDGTKVDEFYLGQFLKIPWEKRDARQIVLVQRGFPGDVPLTEFMQWQERFDEPYPLLCLTAGYPVAALARGDFRRRIEFAAPRTAEDLVATMKARQCRRLFVAFVPDDVQAAVDRAVEEGLLLPIHHNWYALGAP